MKVSNPDHSFTILLYIVLYSIPSINLESKDSPFLTLDSMIGGRFETSLLCIEGRFWLLNWNFVTWAGIYFNNYIWEGDNRTSLLWFCSLVAKSCMQWPLEALGDCKIYLFAVANNCYHHSQPLTPIGQVEICCSFTVYLSVHLFLTNL